MEPLTTVADKLKGLAKAAEDFAHDFVNCRRNSHSRHPIEILKRLQRESFSDIMKIRARQEKVEKILTFSRSSKGGPFEEGSTRVNGKVDVLGALFMMGSADEQKCDAIQRSGIRTGIDARLSFQTVIREKDTLTAEFVASEKGKGTLAGGPLSLAKLICAAHVTNWFSAVVIPMGGQCRDVEVAKSSYQERGLTEYSEFGPPLLNQQNGSAIGIVARKSNVVASLAQFVSDVGIDFNSNSIARSLSTFGQVAWQLSESTKLSILGVHRKSGSSSQRVSLGALALPVAIHRNNRFLETSIEEDNSTSSTGRILEGSIALMFESELDEGKRIGGWIETKNSNPRNLQWAVTTSDTPEDEFGWGLTLGGSLQGPKSWDHFQVETFLNLSFGKKFKLQPALVYVKDRETQFPALMLHSSWSL